MLRNVDGEEFPGTVVGISDVEDMAMIHVEAFEGEAPFASEMEETPVDTEVIALESSKGLENTASIGGPLIDAASGRVIGINSLGYTDDNAFGFSIPLYSVVDTLDELAG